MYVLGTALRRITQDRFVDDQLSWSPNGTKIAFVSNRGGKFGIWVMNANGSGKRLLTADGAVPAWSPDGNTLAFVRTNGRTDAIWMMDADGGNQRRLTVPPQLGSDYARDSMPEWSPDGEALAFVAATGAGPTSG